MVTYTQDQFNRLPKWAQAVIKQSENREETAVRVTQQTNDFLEAQTVNAALAVLNGPDRYEWRGEIVAFRDPYEKEPIPVARERDNIRFKIGEGRHEWVDVTVREGELEITGDRTLLLRPLSSNGVSVRLDER